MAKLEPLASEVYEAALEPGGTISGEQAAAWRGPSSSAGSTASCVQVFREVKDAFDPSNLLNPGKVIGDDPHLMTRDLKRPPARPARARPARLGAGRGRSDVAAPRRRLGSRDATRGEPAGAGSVLDRRSCPSSAGPTAGAVETASACNGCGACRTREPTLRMCPTFRALRSEAASPRAKANLLRQVAAGQVDPKLWGTEEFKANADLCIHCNLCQSGMPVRGRRLEPDARGQGRLRREPRPAPGRLGALAGRALVAAGQPVPDPQQRPDVQPRGPLADRAAVRALAASRAAAGAPDPVRPPGRAAGADPAPAAGSPARGSPTSSTSSPTTSTRSWPSRSWRVLHQAGVNVYVPTRPARLGDGRRWSPATSTTPATWPWRTSGSWATPSATATRSSAPSRPPR